MRQNGAGMTREPSAVRLRALLLFAAVLGLAVASVLRNPQLGVLAGVADEYFNLGARLRVTGTLGIGPNEPSALRPPGYPAFVAAVLWAFVDPPARMPLAAYLAQGEQAVYLAQAVLLSLASTALYLWLRTRLQDAASWAAGLALGMNPFSVALVGLLHYDLLHWLLLVLACWATDEALRSGRLPALTGAGVVWGLANLVRPVTQLLPVFVFLALWIVCRRPARQALGSSAALGLGLALALMPWTIRNHAVTGRLVAGADNPWATLWGQTAWHQPAQPNRYAWFELYKAGFMPVFTRATGLPAYDYAAHNRRIREVEQVFREESLRNVRGRPLVYAGNVARAFASFCLETNSVLLGAYGRLRADARAGRAPEVRQAWFHRGDPEALPMTPLAASYAAWFALVTAAGAMGLGLGLRSRDTLAASTASVFVCVGITHSLVFLHLLHYYTKTPLVLGWTAVALSRLAVSRPRLAASLGALVAGTAAVLGVLLVVAA